MDGGNNLTGVHGTIWFDPFPGEINAVGGPKAKFGAIGGPGVRKILGVF